MNKLILKKCINKELLKEKWLVIRNPLLIFVQNMK